MLGPHTDSWKKLLTEKAETCILVPLSILFCFEVLALQVVALCQVPLVRKFQQRITHAEHGVWERVRGFHLVLTDISYQRQ